MLNVWESTCQIRDRRVSQVVEDSCAGMKHKFLSGLLPDLVGDAKAPTPRYDYNQLMYRLRLDDPNL